MTAGALSFDDAFEILRPALPDDSLVLVGGQAVNYWLSYYRDREASLIGLAGVTSDDVDFYGAAASATRLARVICGTLKVATLDDNTPNSALVTFTDNGGQQRCIDFLKYVHGLKEKMVRETSVVVELADPDGSPTGIELRVLHPVLCLKSRVYNSNSWPKYQNPRALRQVRAAIGCAKGFIRERCDLGEIRSAHRAIKFIGGIARGYAGRGLYKKFGLDPLEAIPEDPRLGVACIENNLPLLRRRARRT